MRVSEASGFNYLTPHPKLKEASIGMVFKRTTVTSKHFVLSIASTSEKVTDFAVILKEMCKADQMPRFISYTCTYGVNGRYVLEIDFFTEEDLILFSSMAGVNW